MLVSQPVMPSRKDSELSESRILHLFNGHDVSLNYAKHRFPIDQAILKRIAQHYTLSGRQCTCVVDVGCGPGCNTVLLKHAFPNAHVTGVDVSASAIQLARQMYGHGKDWMGNGLEFLNANVDADGLPFDDESVDILLSVTAVHWMNTEKLMKEAQRVLKPGGIIVLTSYIHFRVESDSSTYEQMRKYDELTSELWKFFFTWHYASDKLLSMFNEYRDIELPWKENYVHLNEKNCPDLVCTRPITMKQFKDYALTWGSFRNYLDENPDGHVLDEYFMKIGKLTNADNAALRFVAPYFMAMTRKPMK